jgi:voltage-gated potassium channel
MGMQSRYNHRTPDCGGLLMVALPVGIVATAFANEVHRRDFIITWSLLARISLFSELSAVQIGEIMKMLRAQKVDRAPRRARALHVLDRRWRS